MMNPEDVRRLIEAAIPEAKVEVQDLTGGGDHFRATVVSPAFAGKSRIEQHQMVYAPVRELLADQTIHALSIKTVTP
jgi:acid stress-induced BolA-like protein IbaG/YrbA